MKCACALIEDIEETDRKECIQFDAKTLLSIFVSNRLVCTYSHEAHKLINQRKRDGTFRTLIYVPFI